MMPNFDPTCIGDIVDAMYAMISGPAGPRNWSLQGLVFHPEARQVRTGIDAQGRSSIKIMSLADYVADTAAFFEGHDFFEVEVSRRVEAFGNIAHVWSIYEARGSADDVEPERRGINSIQLFRNEHGHWHITSMIWDNERAGLKAV